MANHFHDVNGFLIIGLDGHDGIHIPFVPMWFYSINFLHPFVLGGNQKSTVLFNGVNTVVNQHVTPNLWPHLGVVPDPLNLLTPLNILMGQQQTWVPRGTVLIEGSQATVCVIGGGWTLDLDCWEFGSLPTSLAFNPGTVETTPSLMDYLQGVVTVLVDVALNLVLNAVMPIIAEKVMGFVGSVARNIYRGVSEAIENSFLSALLPTVRDAIQSQTDEVLAGLCTQVGHPVDVVSGAVLDQATDVALPGAIPVVLRRHYSSARALRRTSLGRGGWSHSLDQWIEERPDGVILRDGDGRDVRFPALDREGRAFLRSDQLTLRRDGDGGYVVVGARPIARHFAPATPGGRAWIRRIADRLGNEVIFAYDGERLASVRDTAGRELRFSYTPGGRVERAEVWARGALEQWVDYAYHPTGELARVANALGHADAFAYDEEHRMVQVTLKNGTKFHYAYDEATGRCARTWGDGGLRTAEIRADEPRRIAYVTGGAEPRVYHWNERGVVVREETPEGELVSARELDDDLRILWTRDASGREIRFGYDERGRVIEQRDSSGPGARWTYDGDLLVSRTGDDGVAAKFAYDHRGVLSDVEYVFHAGGDGPTRRLLAFSRDEKGHVVRVEGSAGVLLERAYDAEHNVVEQREMGGPPVRFEHDALGAPVAYTNVLGATKRTRRDALRGVRAVERPDGSVMTFETTPGGHVGTRTDARGRSQRVEWAGTGFPASLTLADGRTWSIERDGDERIRAVVAPSGARAEIDLDNAGRVVRARDFHGSERWYQHLPAARTARVFHPDREIEEHRYDEAGRLVERRARGLSTLLERDAAGRVVRATLREGDDVSVVELHRDGLGRVTAEVQGGRTIRYERTPAGQLTRILPSGSWTRFTPDAHGRPVLIEHDGYRVAVERDAAGRPVGMRFGDGGVVVERRFDAAGRLVGERVRRGEAGDPVERAYAYDPAGVLLRCQDSRWGTTEYAYDAADRLVAAARGEVREAFEYDEDGSLCAVASGGARRALHLAPGNLLQGEDGARYENDARGRRVRRFDAGDGDVTVYRWDAFDRLREVALPSGTRVRFTYDALGRRTKKEVFTTASDAPARVVEYLWEGATLAAELEDGVETRVFVSLPRGVPLLQVERGEILACLTDHLGAPLRLLDGRGALAWEASRSAWGRVLEARREPDARPGTPVASPFGLLGQLADEETGLAATMFRWFDPELGRWLSPDPLGLLGGANLFAFAGAPTNVIDPLGLTSPLCATYDEWFQQYGKALGDWVEDGTSRILATQDENLTSSWIAYQIGRFSDSVGIGNGEVTMALDGLAAQFDGILALGDHWTPDAQKMFIQGVLDRGGPVALFSDPDAFGSLFSQVFDDAGNVIGFRPRVYLDELTQLDELGWQIVPGGPTIFGMIVPPS